MTSLTPKRIWKAARGLSGRLLHGYPIAFNPEKKALIDQAFRRSPGGLRSFADLGGVWGIQGAYTFYALRAHRPHSAVLVDTNLTEEVRARAGSFRGLRLIEGNFGAAGMPDRVGRVDAVFLFDVLLHQVRPNWDRILEMYAAVTDCFIVYNQQFIAGRRTVRLIDLGVEEYFRHVPFDRTRPGYRELIERPDEINPEHQRPWKDVHNIWQWGITDADLIAKTEGLGYAMLHRANHGRFGDFPSFENHSFIFHRRRS